MTSGGEKYDIFIYLNLNRKIIKIRKMSKNEHAIWRIGLFTKLSNESAQCLECKEIGKGFFKLGDSSVSSLIAISHQKPILIPTTCNFMKILQKKSETTLLELRVEWTSF